MTQQEVLYPRAFVVRFKDLGRWDPASYHEISWHWPDKDMKAIGSVLKPRKIKVDLQVTPFDELQPLTVHFDGSVSKRKAKREYSLQLYSALPGDLVISNSGVAPCIAK